MAEGEYIDIHRMKERLAWVEGELEAVVRGEAPHGRRCQALGKANAALILKYERALALLDSAMPATRMKYIENLIRFDRLLQKDFVVATPDDVKQAIIALDSYQSNRGRAYAGHTRHTTRSVVHKFFRWLAWGDDFDSPENQRKVPPTVAWLRVDVNKRDYRRVQAADLLRDDEVLALLDAAKNYRDKAYIAMLYESGSRVGEGGSTRLKHLNHDSAGYYTLSISGKTGSRSPALILAAPYLTAWLNNHPDRGNAEAPLWVQQSADGRIEPLYYDSLRALVRRLAQRAGLTKRVYPHLFRHTRATHVVVHHIMGETQAKATFGWAPDSKMLKEYLHLVMKDVNDSYAAACGLRGSKRDFKLTPNVCGKCNHVNYLQAVVCSACETHLDQKVIHRVHDTRTAFDQFVKVLIRDPQIRAVIASRREVLVPKIAQIIAQEVTLAHLSDELGLDNGSDRGPGPGPDSLGSSPVDSPPS